MSYMKDVRAGSEGNKTLLKQYGGTSGCADRQGYATGGSVGGLNKDGPAMAEGLSAAGTPAKPSLARPSRKIGKGKKKDAKTNINVIVASPPQKDAAGPMPPMGGPPPGPPPMPPPGAGGPPGMPPMRAAGGRVGAGATSDADTAIMGKSGRYKIGGKVKKRADGGEVSPGEAMQAARKRRDEAGTERNERASSGMMSAAATGAMMNTPGAGRIFRGLRALNAGFAGTSGVGAAISQGKKNAAQDEMDRLGKGPAVEGREDRKAGGPVGGLKNSQGGAGGGLGRLAKIRKYGK